MKLTIIWEYIIRCCSRNILFVILILWTKFTPAHCLTIVLKVCKMLRFYQLCEEIRYTSIILKKVNYILIG